jgi:hypothetical protein
MAHEIMEQVQFAVSSRLHFCKTSRLSMQETYSLSLIVPGTILISCPLFRSDLVAAYIILR